ncbi:MAG: hypothetical protein CXT72_07215 [Methanobacteriota archaeon]|nr:MAG: hypothetical protein CXT72_07215 [Euryarchaeota archaeon]
MTGAIPLALEWELINHDERGIEIELPAEITIPNGEALPSLRLRGMIDRVDLLSFDENESIWFDAEGSETIAPLKIIGTDWKPRRLIAIRDLKTSESTKVTGNLPFMLVHGKLLIQVIWSLPLEFLFLVTKLLIS